MGEIFDLDNEFAVHTTLDRIGRGALDIGSGVGDRLRDIRRRQ